MRGVDFSNTSYRRMYLPTAAFKLLGCEAQSVYWALRQVFDPRGYFRLNGAIAAEAVAVEVGWPIDALHFTERGLDLLLKRQWLFYDKSEDALVDPDFYDAEHATKSGKQRARDSRKKKKGDDPPTKDGHSTSDLSTADQSKHTRRKIGFQMSSAQFSQDGLPASSRLNGSEIPVSGSDVDGHPASTPQLEASRLEPMGCPFDRSERPPKAPTHVESPSAPVADLSTPTTKAHPSVSLGSDHPAHVDEPKEAPTPMSIEADANLNRSEVRQPTPSPTTGTAAHFDEPGNDAPPSMLIEADADPYGRTVLWSPEGEAKRNAASWSLPVGGIEFGPANVSGPIALVPASVTNSVARYTLVTFSEKCDAPVTNSPSQYPIPITQSPKSVVFAETGSVCAGARARASPPPRIAESPQEPEPPSKVEGKARSPSTLPEAEPNAWHDTTTGRERFEGGKPSTEASAPKAEPSPRSRTGTRSPDVLPDAEPDTLAEPTTTGRERAQSRGRPEAEPDGSEQRFDEFARYVERCYRHSAKLDRGLTRNERALAREWFDLGIDASIIRETFTEEGEFEPGAVWSLGFFKRTVLRIWRTRRELTAAVRMPDPPPTDFEQRLDDLIAFIPAELPGRADLVASMAKLRGLDPEIAESRLQEIEHQFLGSFPLTIEQKQQIDGLMSQLAQRLPRSEFSRQRKLLNQRLKRESLGLPDLSLFNEQLTQRSS